MSISKNGFLRILFYPTMAKSTLKIHERLCKLCSCYVLNMYLNRLFEVSVSNLFKTIKTLGIHLPGEYCCV